MMLELLAESALRSILLGGGVWLGLTLLRVRSPKLQMTAWTIVVASSLAMPLVTPWIRITLPADPPQAHLVKAGTSSSWIPAPFSSHSAPVVAKDGVTTHSAAAAVRGQDVQAAAKDSLDNHLLNWHALAIAAYACVFGAMMLRLLFGWLVMWWVVRAARPVGGDWAGDADVRESDVVRGPVTFASTILLPSSYTTWSARKLKAVMLHERSHVAHGDSYVLSLAGINRAVFWFNPFAWWLLTRLADLAEMISDDDAITSLTDRRGYADTLLDIARNAQPLPSGLAMARPATVRRRVARILSATTAPRRIGVRVRVATALAIVPMAAVSAATITHGGPVAAQAETDVLPATNGIAGTGPMQSDACVGLFAIGPSILAVTRDGEELFAQLSGQPKLRLTPMNDHEFVDERGHSRLTCAIADGQPAKAVTLRAGSSARQGARISMAKASEMEAAFQRRMIEMVQRFRDQTPTPGAQAALLQMIDDLRQNPPTYRRMSPQLADKMRRQLPELQSTLQALGSLEQVFFRAVGPTGHDVYVAKFANGAGEFRIELAEDGTIMDANVRPDGDGTLGGVADCAAEATLKSEDGTAPIRLSLINRSGDDIRLFSLRHNHERVASGEVGPDRSTDVLTAVGHPMIITDQAGQCRAIVLPGQYTRFYVVEPSGAFHRSSGVRRNTPVAGSDEALQRYLESIRRGMPDYDRMTPEAANTTRQLLSQQRAILARFGALRVMSFRGVNSTGDDMYGLRFADGSAVWQIGLTDDKRIRSIAFYP
jgi:hypothetical protein